MRRDSPSLDQLLENSRVWRGRSQTWSQPGIASGFEQLDRQLPGGGWPAHSLTEVLTEQYGIGELQLLMPALSKLSADDPLVPYAEPGWIAWVAPPFQPYPPALQQWRIDLSRLLIVRPKDDSEIVWSAEQALSSGTCSAVLLWPQQLSDQDSRRLQLAAEKGSSWCVAFRPLSARTQASAAALRIALFADAQGTHLDVFKSRGGRPVRINNLFSG